jgi:dTDP-4-dehydrorhamnose 3,5-epimerase
MEIQQTSIPDLLVIDPIIHGDARGFFLETYHQRKLAAAGITQPFVQDNLSRSRRGILRGLHYQIRQPQGKLVSVLSGDVFDVAVDLRHSSPTFGQWVGAMLTAENRRCLYIPPGCAHGFYVLSETADFFYKCTDFYAPEHERTLLWNDPALAIDWPFEGDPVLSDKDRKGVLLKDAECYE